ncbi:hypothetical protein AVEN_137801-1 [Araneus ventricosus]|uniref:Reverse transcriptase domain-containing protein n=1 Tax=Araneus ventricosus TaxID=182803 RepID=A0A4Y2PHV5_ARAVE|nr:hypothetical protein AVEN_137801-1 [Araneus ventricosus]
MKDLPPRQHCQALRFLHYSPYYNRLMQQPLVLQGYDLPSDMITQDIYKTAVITSIGFFENVFMAFGLHNTVQTIQMNIDTIIRDIPNYYAYMDDLLIASSESGESQD